MAKGFGIAGIIIVLLGMFIPIAGSFICWLGLALATVAALSGDRIFSVVTGLVAAVGVIFFSPLLWAAIAGENMQGGSVIPIVTVLSIFAPFVGIALNASGKVVLGKSNAGQ
jgi:hypothetical protein